MKFQIIAILALTLASNAFALETSLVNISPSESLAAGKPLEKGILGVAHFIVKGDLSANEYEIYLPMLRSGIGTASESDGATQGFDKAAWLNYNNTKTDVRADMYREYTRFNIGVAFQFYIMKCLKITSGMWKGFADSNTCVHVAESDSPVYVVGRKGIEILP